MIYFLHCSSKMSVCHSYVAAAVAASLQTGLHRSLSGGLDPIERETRKRVFWTVRSMEAYVCAILGLPMTINEEDIDQEMPQEVDDIYITQDGISPQPENQLSASAITNAYTRLMQIFSKVLRYVYPVRNVKHTLGNRPGSYRVSYARVCKIEQELEPWLVSLPWKLSATSDLPPSSLR